jgi:hypothetical protein
MTEGRLRKPCESTAVARESDLPSCQMPYFEDASFSLKKSLQLIGAFSESVNFKSLLYDACRGDG